MLIKVLGSGYASCKKLYENTIKAVQNVDKNIEVKYITDTKEIMFMRVMRMPALTIDEKVVSSGKVLSIEEIIELIKQ